MPAYIRENPISLIIFPHRFARNQPLFQQLDKQQHPYVQLPPELPYDPIGTIPTEEHLPRQYIFYDIYYRAIKCHLTDDFIRQLAKDPSLSAFLVDHFRQQPEA